MMVYFFAMDFIIVNPILDNRKPSRLNVNSDEVIHQNKAFYSVY